MARGVLFVDLDGTLVLGNSFHVFIRAIWDKGGVASRIRLIKAALLRLAKRPNGRLAMKRHVMSAYSATSPRLQEQILQETLRGLRAMISEPVMEEIRRFSSKGSPVVLATAAPAVYAEPLARELGLTECLATPKVLRRGAWELLGQAKADRCRNWMVEHGLVGDVEVHVISDHIDDLPLFAMATSATLHARSTVVESLMVAGLNQAPSVIDPVAAQPGGGLWLWIDGAQSGPHDEWEVRMVLTKHRYALLYVGDGRWRRVMPGHSLADGTRREQAPTPPSTAVQWSVDLRRAVIRDRLGIFH